MKNKIELGMLSNISLLAENGKESEATSALLLLTTGSYAEMVALVDRMKLSVDRPRAPIMRRVLNS